MFSKSEKQEHTQRTQKRERKMSDTTGFTKEAPSTVYVKLDDLEKGSVLRASYNGSTQGGEFNSVTHYFVTPAGERLGVNGCAELNNKLAQCTKGDNLVIKYSGKRVMETSHGKVKAHSFWIERQDSTTGELTPIKVNRDLDISEAFAAREA